MTTIATLAVKLIADAAAFASALDMAEKRTQTWSSRVSQNMKTAGSNITSMGMKATTFLTLPFVAGGIAAINYASDLEETKNKVTVVFGEMSSSVLAWSTTSATAMGMSQNTALGAAGTFGNLFTTMGIGQQASADMSMGLVGLAADLASFNNMDPTVVLEKLRSGLVGEVEPLRTLGINLSQAAVEAKAMEMGLAGADGTLSTAAMAQARYALILEQSANAAGDFARTSDGLANQQRILKAQFEDAAAALGAKLLPYALQFVQWASEMVAKFQALTPEQQKWVIVIAAIAAAIGPVLVVIGTLVTAIGAIVGVIGAITAPVLIVIAVIAALVAIGYLLYQAWTNNWGGIQQKVAAVMAFIQNVVNAGINFIQALTQGRLGVLSTIWNGVWKAIQIVVSTAMAVVKSIIAAVISAINGDWYGFGANLRKAWDAVWAGVGKVIENAQKTTEKAIKQFIDFVIKFFKKTNWKELGMAIVRGIVDGIEALKNWALGQVSALGQAIIDVLKGILGISSPSKVMRDLIGRNMALGLMQGFDANLSMPDISGTVMQQVAPTGVSGSAAPATMAGGGRSFYGCTFVVEKETTLDEFLTGLQ